jgi:hypothetical protein
MPEADATTEDASAAIVPLEPAAKRIRLEPSNEIVFEVKVARDCDDNDPNRSKVKDCWYLVCFTETATVRFDVLNDALIAQVVNTTIRNSMLMSGMKVFGRSPAMFFFPKEEQKQVLSGWLESKLYKSIIPLLGLKQSVRMSASDSNQLLLVADFGMRYAYNDAPPKMFNVLEVEKDERSGRPTGKGKLAGITIGNLHKPVPMDQRADVSKALCARNLGRANEEEKGVRLGRSQSQVCASQLEGVQEQGRGKEY